MGVGSGPSPKASSRARAWTPIASLSSNACILNAGDQEANIEIMIYFKDREGAGPYHIKVARAGAAFALQ